MESQHFKKQSTQRSKHYVVREVPIRGVAPLDPEGGSHEGVPNKWKTHTSMGTTSVYLTKQYHLLFLSSILSFLFVLNFPDLCHHQKIFPWEHGNIEI